MDPVWTDSAALDPDDLASGAADTSFVSNTPLDPYEEDSHGDEDEEHDQEQDDLAPPTKKKTETSLIAAPHHKSKRLRSNIQVLGKIANTFDQMSSSQSSRQDAEERRFERMLQFKKEEAEANRKHELMLAQIFAGAISASNNPQPQDIPHNRMGMNGPFIPPSAQYQGPGQGHYNQQSRQTTNYQSYSSPPPSSGQFKMYLEDQSPNSPNY